MTDILRYRWTSFGPMLDEDGPFVTYADHIEALRQATALATPETVMQANYWYEQGQRDALAQAVQRVEALSEYSLRDTCMTAIKGELIMAEHLPECWTTEKSDPPAWCICDELRACEERVARTFKDTRDMEWQTRQLDIEEANLNRNYEKGQKDGYMTGYGAAMDDGWGEPGHIQKAIDEAVKRVENYIQHDVADGWMPRSKAEAIVALVRGT